MLIDVEEKKKRVIYELLWMGILCELYDFDRSIKAMVLSSEPNQVFTNLRLSIKKVHFLSFMLLSSRKSNRHTHYTPWQSTTSKVTNTALQILHSQIGKVYETVLLSSSVPNDCTTPSVWVRCWKYYFFSVILYYWALWVYKLIRQ